MITVKTGLICVGLKGERNDLGKQFHEEAKKAFYDIGIEIVNPDSSFTLTGEDVRKQTEECLASGAQSMVYLAGTWLLAAHVVDAVRGIKVPFGIWGIPEAASFSSVGANVLHGTLDEMGISHWLFYGLPDDRDVLKHIENFTKAAAVKSTLAHTRMGVLGGRAISAYPTTADPVQIKKIFGTEAEHIDQMVLLKKAESVAEEKCQALAGQIREKYGSVDVPEETLKKSASIYYALKEIIEEYSLHMVTVKCIGEFMDSYCSCCAALSMLNDEGYICGCQCNLNALLSGYILSALSKEPHFFGDVNMVDTGSGVARMIHCGSGPGKLAESYKDIDIVEQYEYMGAGRGACTLFCLKEGDVTFGTLGRKNGEYVMNIAKGRAFKKPKEELKAVRTWVQAFIRLQCDPMEFYRNLRCNHSVFGYGSHEEALVMLCEMLGIQAITY